MLDAYPINRLNYGTLVTSIDQIGMILLQETNRLINIKVFYLSYTVVPSRGTCDNQKALNQHFEDLIAFPRIPLEVLKQY